MKAKYMALAMAVVLSLSLTGCFRRNEPAANSAEPTHTPSATVPGNHDNQNDAMNGGGAGGTNDADSGNHSDASPDPSAHVSGDGVLDDIGNAAGDLVEGAGDAIQDAGDAIGNAADNVRGAMR